MDKDIFVTYSRRNQETCRKLVAALARTESDTWVDWEGIPLSSDWWGEIQRGIENAETVLVLLSNDWLTSPVCHLEMAYALSLNKRTVPVVYGQTDHEASFAALSARDLDAAVVDMLAGRDINTIARDNWRALSKINWAFYREEDFTEGASKLLAALQTDLAHARAHTRLLNRALEWGRGNRDTSLLLRGVDLDQAIGWLAYNAETEPFPTDLHREYISASQKQRETEENALRDQQARELALQARALNRARMLIASLGVFLVVAGLLSVFALQQRSEAVEQAVRADDNASTAESNAVRADHAASTAIAERDRADREAQIAKAREIAAQALGLRDNRSAQAMLLGIAAYQTAPVFEAESALLTLMGTSSGLLKTFYHQNKQGIIQVIYNPSETLMAEVHFWGEDRLSIMDMLTGEIIYTLGGATEVPNSRVYFLDDTTLLLSDFFGVHSLKIDLATQSVKPTTLFEYPRSEFTLYASVFSDDGRRVATAALNPATGQHFMVIHDLNTAQELYREAIDFQVLSMAFNSDGTRILANRYRDTPVLFDIKAASMSPLITQNLEAEGIQQAYFYEGDTYLTLTSVPGNEGQFIAIYDPESDLFSEPIYVPLTVNRLALHPGKQWVMAMETGGKFTLYRLVDGQAEFTSTYHENEIFAVVFNQAGNLMVTGDSGGMLATWDLYAKPALQRPIEDSTSPAIAMSLAGERLAVSIENDSIRQYDITTWQEVGARIPVGEEFLYLTVLYLSEDHNRLIALESGLGQIFVWDAETGELLTESLTGSAASTYMTASPDGRLVVAYHPDTGISLWDVEKQAQVGDFFRFESDLGVDITNHMINTVFSPDGTQLAAIATDGYVWLYDVTIDGMTLQKRVSLAQPLQIGLRFSPDGRLLALASFSNTVLLYDIETEQLTVPPLSGSESFIFNIAFRPDGRVLAVMDGYSQLWLWDTARGLPIGLPTQAHYIAYDAAFTSDGQRLITVGSDPVISEWDFRPEQSIESLCFAVGRDLTESEWALYMGESQPYRAVCGG